MAEEPAPDLDYWKDIENASLSAFDSFVNKNAPDLAATLQRAAVYAKADIDAAEIVVDRRAFLFGLVAYGLVDSPSPSFGNIATWIAGWIAARAGARLVSAVQGGVTAKDHLINLYAHGAHVVASNSMRSCAGLAVRYALQTAGRDVADLRHFIAAFIENPSAATTDMAAVGWAAKPEDIAGLQRELYGRIAENAEPSEDLAAWRLILHVDEPAIPVSDASSPPPPPPPSEVSGFTSDRAESLAAGDPLELLADVKAFARLICLEEAEPPLSIGLFGGWGSGKSTFMQLLEGEIDTLTQKTRKAAKAKSGCPRIRRSRSRVHPQRRPGAVQRLAFRGRQSVGKPDGRVLRSVSGRRLFAPGQDDPRKGCRAGKCSCPHADLGRQQRAPGPAGERNRPARRAEGARRCGRGSGEHVRQRIQADHRRCRDKGIRTAQGRLDRTGLRHVRG